MPSNTIIFDAGYVSELVSGMNIACELMSEAVSSLKKASLHEGWKCKECTRISESIDDLNERLGRLDNGINETTRILTGSVGRFEGLEARYASQADTLSEDLRENHGYKADVHESSSITTASVNPNTPSNSAAPSQTQTEASELEGANSGGHGRTSGGRGPAGGAGAMISNIAGQAAREQGRRTGGNMNRGEANMTVNLPVTHIPDRPEAAARGVKDTQEIADIAVSSVAVSITEALTGHTHSGSSSGVRGLIETYNAGKSIVENSEAIISNPAMPHTQERLAMAAGLVSLAGSALTGISMMGRAAGSVQTSGTPHTSSVPSHHEQGGLHSSGDLTRNASSLRASMASESDAGELVSLLEAIASPEGISGAVSSVSSRGSGKKSFFDKIIEALKKAMDGETSTGTSSSSTPVQEFLGSFMIDEVV